MELIIIQKKSHEIRGQRVILDFDLAELYEVGTKVLNQAIKRNIEKFPSDFMFRLTAKEWKNISSLSVITLGSPNLNNRSQFVTGSQKHRPKSIPPYAFTEHGVAMLASVLHSEKAIKMNIAIVRAFIALRQFAVNYTELAKEIKELKEITGSHNIQLNQIYDAIENLLDENAEKRKWEERERIGFRTTKKN